MDPVTSILGTAHIFVCARAKKKALVWQRLCLDCQWVCYKKPGFEFKFIYNTLVIFFGWPWFELR